MNMKVRNFLKETTIEAGKAATVLSLTGVTFMGAITAAERVAKESVPSPKTWYTQSWNQYAGKTADYDVTVDSIVKNNGKKRTIVNLASENPVHVRITGYDDKSDGTIDYVYVNGVNSRDDGIVQTVKDALKSTMIDSKLVRNLDAGEDY